MDLDTSDDGCSLTVPSASTSTGYSSCSSSGDKYLTVRRHTVGPGDPAHEQVKKLLFSKFFFYTFLVEVEYLCALNV